MSASGYDVATQATKNDDIVDETEAAALEQDCHNLTLKLAEMVPLCSFLEAEITRLTALNELIQSENDTLRRVPDTTFSATASSTSSTPASPRPSVGGSLQVSPNGTLRKSYGQDSEMKQRLHSANLLNQTQSKQYEFEIKRITLDRDLLKAQLEREIQQKFASERDKKKLVAGQRELELQLEKMTNECRNWERKFKNSERQRAEVGSLLQTEEKTISKLQEQMTRQIQFHKKEVERLLYENQTEMQSLEGRYQEELDQERKKSRKELEKMNLQQIRVEEQYHNDAKHIQNLKKEIESVEIDKKELEVKKELKRSSSFKKRSMSTVNPTTKLGSSIPSPLTKRNNPPFK
jgi:myosin heavy subunit